MAERVFVMPDLGEGLEEGRIVAWLVGPGDEVALNQPLVEVETAKAAVEIPSPFVGQVVTLHGAQDEDVAVGAPLVTFEVVGEAVSTARGPVRATPPVRKLAKELGVDLAAVTGTGPGGRITEDDVRAAIAGELEAAEVAAGEIARVELTPARRAIAANLERQARIPQVTTFRTVDCTALAALRTELGVSPLPVVVAALCRVVEAHPMLNAAWADDHIAVSHGVHVGLAADTERGLVVPVLRDAQDRGILEMAADIRRLAERARDGTLPSDELNGATIAISNTGSYGSESGTPILSPGTAVTLAVGVIALRALVIGGAVEARAAATLSLTFDHRVLDGAAVGRALTDLVALLESAERLGELPR